MTHPTDESLKPCPFCGGAASLHPRTCDKNTPYNPADRAFPVARCGQCGAEALGKDWGKPETAAEKWNARALLAEQARTEPVAWVYWHPSDTTHDGPDTLHKKAVSRFTDDTRKAMMAKGWLFEPLYPASTAAQPLKAEQAKDAAEDAELLEWLEEKHYALHPIKEDQGDDTYTLWWQVTDKDKSISGHPLGNIRAAIRAARAAERKA